MRSPDVFRRVPIDAVLVDVGKLALLSFLARVRLPPKAWPCPQGVLLPHFLGVPLSLAAAMIIRGIHGWQGPCNAVL